MLLGEPDRRVKDPQDRRRRFPLWATERVEEAEKTDQFKQEPLGDLGRPGKRGS